MCRTTRYFTLARREALQSEFEQFRLGAVIVKGNYVVSRGRNRPKSHPMQRRYEKYRGRSGTRFFVHAEIDALIRSGYEDLTGCEIFVHRETRAATPGNSRPCPACERALIDAGVRYIHYTTDTETRTIELY